MKSFAFIIGLCLIPQTIPAQAFSHADTLRGTVTAERSWWDVLRYDLEVEVFPKSQRISGRNTLSAQALRSGQVLQIDLQTPMHLTKAAYKGRKCIVTSVGAAHFIDLGCVIQKGETFQLRLDFEGHPKKSKTPPWDGGLVWTRDADGYDLIASACQGAGASLWWPCKDHPYDEADDLTLSIITPEHLFAVANGRLQEIKPLDQKKKYIWEVRNPINNYGVNINIGNYTHFDQIYSGEQGPLTMDFYVLPQHLEAARSQFIQAPRMMEAMEYWLGPYPFYEDGYKLVEVPYLGMEHQSSVTYGNRFKNGYLGKDLSNTGMGLLFDFIIIHESAHEWFANSITAADNADMWIHESFTHYAESLFLEYWFGKDTAYQYLRGVRSKIKNDQPIQGVYGVNHPGSGDMYYKGANVIHTLRMVVGDDGRWRQILRNMNQTFRHSTLLADDLIDFLEEETQMSLSSFFEQYFQTTQIPILEYRIYSGGLEYRWTNVVDHFNMPVDVFFNGQKRRLHPSQEWKRYEVQNPSSLEVDINYYIASMKIN